MNKKKLEGTLGLYPTPAVIVGTVVDGRVNWINIAHLGIIGMDCLVLSMDKSHYSNRGIRENKTASVNLMTEEILVPGDYVGMVSGHKVDKSQVFDYYEGDLKQAPLIKASRLSMECELVDVYETESEDNFILRVVNTYVDQDCLNDQGKIDYEKVRPLLFEMPTRSYLETGKKLASCWEAGKAYKK